MIRAFILVLGSFLAAGTALAQEGLLGDPAAGRKLAGQPASYLAAQLTAFRDKTRDHEMMSVVTKGLTDQAIADLSAWYAQYVPTATLAADPADAPELCTSCHGVDGISIAQDAPNLAGESTVYIATQLKDFRLGKRMHEAMSAIAAELSDEEIREVAEWYAAVKLEISAPE